MRSMFIVAFTQRLCCKGGVWKKNPTNLKPNSTSNSIPVTHYKDELVFGKVTGIHYKSVSCTLYDFWESFGQYKCTDLLAALETKAVVELKKLKQ